MEDAENCRYLLRLSVLCVKTALGVATDLLTVRASRMYPRMYLSIRCFKEEELP